jgi:hypothetical protein
MRPSLKSALRLAAPDASALGLAPPLDAGLARGEREAIYIFRHASNSKISKSPKPPQSPLPHSNHPKSLNNLISTLIRKTKNAPFSDYPLPAPLLDGPPPFRYSLPAEKIFSPGGNGDAERACAA